MEWKQREKKKHWPPSKSHIFPEQPACNIYRYDGKRKTKEKNKFRQYEYMNEISWCFDDHLIKRNEQSQTPLTQNAAIIRNLEREMTKQ